MSDVRLNDKSVASDAAYIYAETASGEQVRISKADLATVVAGIIAPGLGGTVIHGGILRIVEGETQTLALGSGMLILSTQGAAVCSVYYIDYWSSSIKVVHESDITTIGLSLSKGEKTSEILISSYRTRNLNYLFIGERF